VQRGFSLIEVLVALVIVATAITALITLQTESARSLSALEQRALADIVAENRMVAQWLAAPPPEGVTRGTVRLAGRQWGWTQRVRATAEPALRRIEVTIRAEGSEQTLAGLTGFRAR